MGFLDRLRGTSGASAKTTVTTSVSQHLEVKVPAANAMAVKTRLERWAQSKGWAAVVRTEGEGEFVKLTLEHDETLPGTPPDVDLETMSHELEQVVREALKR